MGYVIGIDTGGTYTDAVLIDTRENGPESVKSKSKAFTTHHELELGIRNSIANLKLTHQEIEHIDRIILSTTLATNAIVEGNIHRVGLILIGGIPTGQIATKHIKTVSGGINIKGRILFGINEVETTAAINELIPDVDSIAVSCLSSVRNPILELKVQEIIKRICDIPVVCGHQLASELGFLERTNTAVINAGLLPIINQFIKAIKTVLEQCDISAPVFVVKGDGNISKIDIIQNSPIDTVLSGPAASIVGAINLTGLSDTIVADMGGTTTDTGVVRKKRVALSADGARVGDWKLRVKSAQLHTFGIGGDSQIKLTGGVVKIGPERVLPACRGGKGFVTPTDILHYTGEFVKWNKYDAIQSIQKNAKAAGVSTSDYVDKAKNAIAQIIKDNMAGYSSLKLPISAIGAPAEYWYHLAQDDGGDNLIVPKHFEVANAIGAATAGIEEEVESVVRSGEDGYGYLVHTKVGRYTFIHKDAAVNEAIKITREYAIQLITDQDLELSNVTISYDDIHEERGKIITTHHIIHDNEYEQYINEQGTGTYIETRIKVSVRGKIFHN